MRDGILGVALILFAMLWNSCTDGMEQISLLIGIAGVACTAIGTSKR